MSDARTVLREFSYLDCGWYPHEKASDKCARCDGFADAILAALAEAGLGIVHKPKFRAKLNAKAMKYLDDLAEAEEAMAGKHALSILLKHYREMTEAANEQ